MRGSSKPPWRTQLLWAKNSNPRITRERNSKRDEVPEEVGIDILAQAGKVWLLIKLLEFAGLVSVFGFRVVTGLFRSPFEGAQIGRQLAEVGSKSLALVVASGFALGTVMTFHTRSTLVTFGATAMIPAVQALAFFVEIGPLVVGLLIAGRVGSGIGAVLANMRATEQIDAIESLSVDSFKFLVVPRVVACFLALP